MLKKIGLPAIAFLLLFAGNIAKADLESQSLKVFKRSLNQERVAALKAASSFSPELESTRSEKRALENFEKNYGKIFRTTSYAFLHPDVAKVCGSVEDAVRVKNRLNCYQAHFEKQGRFEGRIVGTQVIYNLPAEFGLPARTLPVEVYFDPLVYNITSGRRVSKIESLYEIANKIYQRSPIPGGRSFDAIAALSSGNPEMISAWEIFSPSEYALANPDLRDPSFSHFSRDGLKEGRIGSSFFNVESYRSTNPKYRNLSNFEVAVDYIKNNLDGFPSGVAISRVPSITSEYFFEKGDYRLPALTHRPFRYTNSAFDRPKPAGNERISDLVFDNNFNQLPVRIVTNSQGLPVIAGSIARPTTRLRQSDGKSPFSFRQLEQVGKFNFDFDLGRFHELAVNFPVQTARWDLLGEENLNSNPNDLELLWWDSTNYRMGVWRVGVLRNNPKFSFQVLGTSPVVNGNGTPYSFIEGANQIQIPVGLQDMDGDGQADVIVRNSLTNRLKVVVLRDSRVSREYLLNYNLPLNHVISGSGIFTADNRPALVEITQNEGLGVSIRFLIFEGPNLVLRTQLGTSSIVG
jgi:hypothetical protein